MKRSILIAAAALATSAFAGVADAAVTFTTNGAPDSSLSVFSNPTFCLGNCKLTTNLSSPVTFSLDEGQSHTFDFGQILINGGLGAGSASVGATLSFLTPGGSASTNGSAGYATAFGIISGGFLTWTNPTTTVMAGGNIFDVTFGNLAGVTFGNGAYVPVTVALRTEAAVPEAATWAMMIAGFGLVGASMRRRSAHRMVQAV